MSRLLLRRMSPGWLGGLLVALLPCAAAPAALIKAGDTFVARDTLALDGESSADAAECLAGLRWTNTTFTVKCAAARDNRGDWLVRFPSPRPMGDATNDLVGMEWRVAKDADGLPKRAPAIVVVHEAGRGMAAGRIAAHGLNLHGYHTFLIHLPGYGVRTPKVRPGARQLLPGLKQAVADVRRARDAVAVLPFIDTTNIALQGTSLGGFVTATVTGLDHGYSQYFVVLAGGNIADMVLQGERDAASFRNQLRAAGMTDDQIRAMTRAVEPLRLAHRVDPARTWMFYGSQDEVVPPACSEAFCRAAGLAPGHRQVFPVGHYTAAFALPTILLQITDVMKGRPPRASELNQAPAVPASP